MAGTGLTNHAQLAQGATVSIGGISGAGGTETFALFGDFISLSLDGGSRPIIDVSTLASTFKEKLGGLSDMGKATLMTNRLPFSTDPGTTTMYAASGNGYPYDFEIQLPINPRAATPQATKGDSCVFSAIVSSGPSWKIENNSSIQNTWQLELNGPITWTEGS